VKHAGEAALEHGEHEVQIALGLGRGEAERRIDAVRDVSMVDPGQGEDGLGEGDENAEADLVEGVQRADRLSQRPVAPDAEVSRPDGRDAAPRERGALDEAASIHGWSPPGHPRPRVRSRSTQ
jgi:hypothetical protein